MTDFTDQEKLACLEREVKMRRWVYPKRVREGIMPPSLATREIALMGSDCCGLSPLEFSRLLGLLNNVQKAEPCSSI